MKTEELSPWPQAIIASVVAVGFGFVGFLISYDALGGALFLAVPFCTGLAIAFMSKGRRLVLITALTSLLLSLGLLVVYGIEGAGCALMSLPILFLSIGSGSLAGWFFGKKYIKNYGNITVIALSLLSMTLIGWANRKPATPEALVVTSEIIFEAPIEAVWESVVESGEIQGDDRALRFLGLPVPKSCTFDSESGIRICYFDTGEMVQEVTTNEYGQTFRVKITESLELRDWLDFVDAGYEFKQEPGFVRVIRTDTIESRLRPRWYWHWFESQCVKLEHRYVMRSMKRKAESPATLIKPH